MEQRGLPQVEDVHFFRGEALLSQRRVTEAEAAFRSETQHFPENRKAWSSLSLVVGGQQRRDEARAILLEGLRRNPDPEMADLARESFSVMSDSQGLREMKTISVTRASRRR